LPERNKAQSKSVESSHINYMYIIHTTIAKGEGTRLEWWVAMVGVPSAISKTGCTWYIAYPQVGGPTSPPLSKPRVGRRAPLPLSVVHASMFTWHFLIQCSYVYFGKIFQ